MILRSTGIPASLRTRTAPIESDTILSNSEVVYEKRYITDSITNSHCSPNESFAYSALQYHNRQLVFDYINNAFGYYNGWVFYLDLFQSDLTQPSSNIYDIYGYIDYWTPAFDVFYTLEYYWRLTYIGGDPSDMNNWQLSEPPLGSAFHPGVRLKTDTTQPQGQIK